MTLSVDSPLDLGEVHRLLQEFSLPDTTVDVNSKVPLALVVINHRWRLRVIAGSPTSAPRAYKGASRCVISTERPLERHRSLETLIAAEVAVANMVRELLTRLTPHGVYNGDNQAVDWEQLGSPQ